MRQYRVNTSSLLQAESEQKLRRSEMKAFPDNKSNFTGCKLQYMTDESSCQTKYGSRDEKSANWDVSQKLQQLGHDYRARCADLEYQTTMSILHTLSGLF